MVMFDRSDVSDGHMLEMHSWTFDDHTTLTILGNVEAVSAAVAHMG
jgi:hypothetical protein